MVISHKASRLLASLLSLLAGCVLTALLQSGDESAIVNADTNGVGLPSNNGRPITIQGNLDLLTSTPPSNVDTYRYAYSTYLMPEKDRQKRQVCTAVDGGWSSWTQGQCSATCGSAFKTRTRTCTNPAPNECGQRCPGDNSATELCSLLPSCCGAGATGSANLSITSTKPVIGSDPESEDIPVVVQCQAFLCPGDNLSSLTLSYSSGPGAAEKVDLISQFSDLMISISSDNTDLLLSLLCLLHPGSLSAAPLLAIGQSVEVDRSSTGKLLPAVQFFGAIGQSFRADQTIALGSRVYALASSTTDGGLAVDKIQLPRTHVLGDIRRSAITYVFFKAKCEDAGVYECSANMLNNGKAIVYTNSLILQVIVTQSKFTLTPRDSPVNLKVGDVLELECSGTVGTITSSTKIEIIWEYKNKGANSSWSEVRNPRQPKGTKASPGSCTTMVEARVLRLVLTSEDRDRTYRCCMKKDGKGCGENNTGYTGAQYTIKIDSNLISVSKASLQITPDVVTLNDTKPVQVTVRCHGSDSQNKLVSLLLSFRPSTQNATSQTQELAVTEKSDSVIVKSDNGRALVSGGLETRSIDYVLPQVTCLDMGTYQCTTKTRLQTTSKTDTVDGRLRVLVTPNFSILTTNATSPLSLGSQLDLQCSTIALVDKDVQWSWEYTTYLEPEYTTWIDVKSTEPDAVITTETVQTDHGCFSVSMTKLTIPQLSKKYQGRVYRCFVTVDRKAYAERAAYRTMELEQAKKSTVASNIHVIIGSCIGGVTLIAMVFFLFMVVVKKHRAAAQPYERKPSTLSAGKPVNFLAAPSQFVTGSSAPSSSFRSNVDDDDGTVSVNTHDTSDMSSHYSSENVITSHASGENSTYDF